MLHYSFDEMVDYIYDDKLDLRKAAEVNKHIYYCEECRKTYEAILEVYDAIDAWKQVNTEENSLKVRLIEVANRIKDTNQQLAARIYEIVKGLGSRVQNLSLQILSLEEIEAFANGVRFSHPQMATVLKSTTANVTPNKFIKSQAVEPDTFQRVSIEQDGTFTMFIPYDESLLNREVILVCDDEKGEIRTGRIGKVSDKEMYVCIDDVTPGNYMIFW